MTHDAFIIEFDDWYGIYVDGKLWAENHHASARDIAETVKLAAGMDWTEASDGEVAAPVFTLRRVYVEQMPEVATFPATLAELEPMYDFTTGLLNPGFPAMDY